MTGRTAIVCLEYRYRCRQIPAFCDDVDWPVLEWEMLYDQHGEPLSGEEQEESWFYTPTDREGEYATFMAYRATSAMLFVSVVGDVEG